jgi:ATP-dependent RNA helicase MSS116
MMRTSLLRQAAVARVALAARPAAASFRASSAALALSGPCRSTAALYRPASALARFYSSESTAQQTSTGSNELITKFADLPQIGVHERLVRAITQGMGYEDMSEVQTKTINAALAGKDV